MTTIKCIYIIRKKKKLITFIYLQELLRTFSISENVLPKIQASADDFGKVIDGSALNDIPISGVSPLNCLHITYTQIKN